jgi:hypothetical protein
VAVAVLVVILALAEVEDMLQLAAQLLVLPEAEVVAEAALAEWIME